jgi:glycosyltransferase involved in cell wall biosynthesis
MLTRALNYIPLFLGNNGISKSFSDKFMYDLYEERKYASDLAAVFRVFDAENSLLASFLSLAPFINEVVIVDNASKDQTADIITKIDEYCSRFHIKFKRKFYGKRIVRFGPGYLNRLQLNPAGSIADYYNFAFADCDSRYLLKADSGLIFFPSAMIDITGMLEKKRPVIRFRGVEISGKTMAYEPRIFSQGAFDGFHDSTEYEVLKLKDRSMKYDPRNFYLRPAYIHYRRIFSHYESSISSGI